GTVSPALRRPRMSGSWSRRCTSSPGRITENPRQFWVSGESVAVTYAHCGAACCADRHPRPPPREVPSNSLNQGLFLQLLGLAAVLRVRDSTEIGGPPEGPH